MIVGIDRYSAPGPILSIISSSMSPESSSGGIIHSSVFSFSRSRRHLIGAQVLLNGLRLHILDVD